MKVARALATTLWMLLTAALVARGEIVDRIAAVVEDSGAAARAITWSALCDEANYQAFRKHELPPRWAASSPSDTNDSKEILQKMIDQALIEQALERSPFTSSGEEGVEDPLEALAKDYSGAEEFHKELARYHLAETAVADRLRRESRLAQFVDATLRSQAKVTAAQVEDYYQHTLLNQLRPTPATGESAADPAIPPLDEVRTQIEEILTQQQMGRLLEDWVAELRRRAKIEILIGTDRPGK